jgi:hypothetical protein
MQEGVYVEYYRAGKDLTTLLQDAGAVLTIVFLQDAEGDLPTVLLQDTSGNIIFSTRWRFGTYL